MLRDRTKFIQTDIGDPAQVETAFGQLDRLDVLVNNAGIQRIGVVGEQPFADWEAVLGINLSGPFLCSSAAVPFMKRQGRGAIVMIASAAAFVALPGRAAYSAAKAGLIALARVMAVELAPYGVRANVVAPGFTATGLVNQAISDGSLESSWMLERVPAGRLAEPAEIAACVSFLASDAAAYVTGQTLLVDGGWTIQGMAHRPERQTSSPEQA